MPVVSPLRSCLLSSSSGSPSPAPLTSTYPIFCPDGFPCPGHFLLNGLTHMWPRGSLKPMSEFHFSSWLSNGPLCGWSLLCSVYPCTSMCCFHLLDIVKVCAHVCLNTCFPGMDPGLGSLQSCAPFVAVGCTGSHSRLCVPEHLSQHPPQPWTSFTLCDSDLPPSNYSYPTCSTMFELPCLFLCF